MSRKPKNNEPDRKPQFCDPGACDLCEAVEYGTFMCNRSQQIVVENWQPTRHHLKCRGRRRK